jgi:hypothetical protein
MVGHCALDAAIEVRVLAGEPTNSEKQMTKKSWSTKDVRPAGRPSNDETMLTTITSDPDFDPYLTEDPKRDDPIIQKYEAIERQRQRGEGEVEPW